MEEVEKDEAEQDTRQGKGRVIATVIKKQRLTTGRKRGICWYENGKRTLKVIKERRHGDDTGGNRC